MGKLYICISSILHFLERLSWFRFWWNGVVLLAGKVACASGDSLCLRIVCVRVVALSLSYPVPSVHAAHHEAHGYGTKPRAQPLLFHLWFLSQSNPYMNNLGLIYLLVWCYSSFEASFQIRFHKICHLGSLTQAIHVNLRVMSLSIDDLFWVSALNGIKSFRLQL